MWKKTDLFWVLRSKPNRVFGLTMLIWAPDFVLRPRRMSCCSCAYVLSGQHQCTWISSLTGNSNTASVSSIWFWVFFKKPSPRPDTSRNRKYNPCSPEVYNCPCWVVMSPVMIILSFSRADPWLWGLLHSMKSQGFLWFLKSLIWSELLLSFICSSYQNWIKAHKFLHGTFLHGHEKGACYLFEPQQS